MHNLINNDNSFIQWHDFPEVENTDTCQPCDETNISDELSLPLFDITDIAFQIRFENTDEDFVSNVSLGLFVGCTPPNNPVTDADFIATFSMQYAENTDGSWQVAFSGVNEIDLCNLVDQNTGLIFVLFNSGLDQYITHSKQVFYSTCNVEFTRRVKYRCNENAFGFNYVDDLNLPNGDFYNMVRIPINVHSPQYPKKSRGYLKGDGSYIKTFGYIAKEFTVDTDLRTALFHQAMAAALESDYFAIYDDGLRVYQQKAHTEDNSYDIEYKNVPGFFADLGYGSFKFRSTPFNHINTNCL